MQQHQDRDGILTLIEENYDHDSILPKQILLNQRSIKIGRGSTNTPVDVILTIKAHGKEIISRYHAEIIKINNSYEIHDKGSINGVFVNNIRIDQAILQEGDRIQFGGVAKVPVGRSVKHSAEHATYIFSYQSPKTPKSTNLNPTTSSLSNHDLVKQNQELQQEINSLKLQLSQLSKTSLQNVAVNTSPLPRPVEQRPSKASECLIDFSALEDLLKCSLCQMILLDAVVCRCSHGFCRACLERYWRTKHDQPINQSVRTLCPICIGESSTTRKRNQAKIASGKNPYCQYYTRSANIDNVVYLLQQSRSDEELKNFTQREKDHHEILRNYGIDPLASPLDEQYDIQLGNIQDQSVAISSKSKLSKIRCDYCGEDGHNARDCPYDDATEKRKRSKYGQYHRHSENPNQDDVDSDGSNV